MILRKPYAFIMKNFRKIHIVFFIIAGIIFFQNSQVQNFVKEFLSTNSYNSSIESIGSYISILNYLLMLLLIAISVALMYVLHLKKKPWKAYLLPFVAYIFLFGVTIAVASYFNNYGDESTLVAIRTISQLLQMASLFQYVIFIMLFIRIAGIDLKKFDFKNDPEFLEIKEEDREEFEVNVEIDKDRIVRFFKKQWRFATYAYQAHPIIFNTLFAVIILSLFGYTYYYFGVLHKTYKQGNTFSALNYQIRIEESYFTDKDYRGVDISNTKDYLAIVVRMKNNGGKRTINLNRFHLLNKSHAYSYMKGHDASFKDLGSTLPEREFKPGEEVKFYLVFEVDKNLSNSNFTLYYQDILGSNKLLYRKIKLKPIDLHEIKTVKTKEKNQKITLSGVSVNNKTIELLDASIGDSATYSYLGCGLQSCSVQSKQYSNPSGKVLTLLFASMDFDDTEFIEFTETYGSIVYQLGKNKKKKTIQIKGIITDDYLGKNIYVNVPNEIENATSISVIYTIRNQAYEYKIK